MLTPTAIPTMLVEQKPIQPQVSKLLLAVVGVECESAVCFSEVNLFSMKQKYHSLN